MVFLPKNLGGRSEKTSTLNSDRICCNHLGSTIASNLQIGEWNNLNQIYYELQGTGPRAVLADRYK